MSSTYRPVPFLLSLPAAPRASGDVLRWISDFTKSFDALYGTLAKRLNAELTHDVAANRPAPEGSARIFFATDTGIPYYDAGTWRTFNIGDLTKAGSGTNYNEGGQANHGTDYRVLGIADGSIAAPVTSTAPTFVVQRIDQSTGALPFQFSVERRPGGSGILYAVHSFIRQGSNTSGDAVAVTGSIFVQATDSTTLGTAYGLWGRAERGSPGARIVGMELDCINSGLLGISNATNASPIVITTSQPHGLESGDEIHIAGVVGNTAANGNWSITKLTSTTFSIPVAGSGAYTSGGTVSADAPYGDATTRSTIGLAIVTSSDFTPGTQKSRNSVGLTFQNGYGEADTDPNLRGGFRAGIYVTHTTAFREYGIDFRNVRSPCVPLLLADGVTIQVMNAATNPVPAFAFNDGNISIGTQAAPISNTAGRTYLQIRGSTLAGALELSTATADADQATVGLVQFSDRNASGGEKRVAIIDGRLDGGTANNRGGMLRFLTKANNGTIAERARINQAGLFNWFKGADVASAAAITPSGNLFHVTGTTNVTSVDATGVIAGTVITIIFDGALTFTDGSNLKLAGNFVTTADDTISLVYDGSNWFELFRSVN